MISPVRFLKAVRGDPPKAPYRIGIVTLTSPLRVTFDGDPDDRGQTLKRIASYTTPVLNDRVLCLRTGREWVIFGKLT